MHLLILLSLSDEFLYDVFEELIAIGLWLQLEKFFYDKINQQVYFGTTLVWPLNKGRYATEGTS